MRIIPRIGDTLHTFDDGKLKVVDVNLGCTPEENCFLVKASNNKLYMVTNGLMGTYWIEVVDNYE